MTRAFFVAVATAVVAGVTGCGAAQSHLAAAAPGVAISADLPPSPATWPTYPKFSWHSCWGRLSAGALLGQVAPSYAPAPRAHPVPPEIVARHLLARLGDRRFVRSITFAPAPPTMRRHYSAPGDVLRATVVLRDGYRLDKPRHRSPAAHLKTNIAWFESGIVAGALRDDLCDAGGPSLIDSSSWWALDQRFPNPSPAAFRKRVALVGRRFGFTVASLRLLRPRQIAPVLIVKTARPRATFAKDIPQIMKLLNPGASRTQHGNVQTAITFEAFFFAAEDAHGPFVSSEYLARNGWGGGEWAASRNILPYTGHG